MGKKIDDTVLDGAIAVLDNGTRLTVLSGEPANFAGIAAVLLAEVAITAGVGNGDWTKGNGDVSGRKATLAAQSAVDIDADGTATHVGIDDGSTLLSVTTCTSQALTSGGTVDVGAFDHEWADPT